MNKKIDLEALTLSVLSAYYRNDMALFSRHAADHFLFAVPELDSSEQTPHSIQTLSLCPDPDIRNAIRKADASVFFQSSTVCPVLMTYALDIYRKEIPVVQKNQQIMICWHNVAPSDEEEPVWRMVIFQITDCEPKVADMAGGSVFPSVAMPRDAAVSEYRVPYTPFRKDLIRIKDRSHTIHVLEKDDIIWVESDHMHSIIHTHSGTIHAGATLSQLAAGTLSCLYRPHISYLINPRYLFQICHMRLVLTDGTTIPVPERRFAQVKRDLFQYIS